MWKRVIQKGELSAIERAHAVISTKLVAGRTVVRVLNDTTPGKGFEPVEPNLEDVYFSTLARQDTARPEPVLAGAR